MQELKAYFQNKLNEREKEGILRSLPKIEKGIDFYSNDYLGFARHPAIQEFIKQDLESLNHIYLHQLNGSTGSRLISGQSNYLNNLEAEIAHFHEFESALIFNSGYTANLSLLSSLGDKSITFLYDEFCHASLIDGMRLSYAKRYKFKHNCLQDLENLLQKQSGICFIITESVFSMDGDLAPLTKIVELATQYQAQVIVDEAHALGLFGQNGKGLVQHLNLNEKIFACVFTYGKAFGSHGAAVCGSEHLKNYLINYARPFIYTTAPSLHQLAAIKAAYHEIKSQDYTKLIQTKNQIFAKKLQAASPYYNISDSCIHILMLNDQQKAKNIAQKLLQANINIKAILAPTVAVGTERIRLVNHLFNTNKEENILLETLKSAL